MVRLIEDQTIYTMTGSVLEQPSSNHLNRNGFHNGIEQYQNDSINEQIDGQITKPHCSDFEFVEQNQLIIEETSKNQSVPPPPPPPPPVPPHSQTATKPKISAKPDFLTNGVSKPSPPPIAQKPILNQKNNLIDEMAKTLARRRAKIDNQSTDEISIDRSSQSVLEKSSTNQNQSSRIG
ncbi:hypothetical protein QR98_0073760 [Sarcoptes scabiei]|nr:hypothetical protein QR98_0073760 [Sarcoptes scabiei]